MVSELRGAKLYCVLFHRGDHGFTPASMGVSAKRLVVPLDCRPLLLLHFIPVGGGIWPDFVVLVLSRVQKTISSCNRANPLDRAAPRHAGARRERRSYEKGSCVRS